MRLVRRSHHRNSILKTLVLRPKVLKGLPQSVRGVGRELVRNLPKTFLQEGDASVGDEGKCFSLGCLGCLGCLGRVRCPNKRVFSPSERAQPPLETTNQPNRNRRKNISRDDELMWRLVGYIVVVRSFPPQ